MKESNNAFIVTFDQFHESLLNKSRPINFFKKNKNLLTPNL